MEGTEFRGKVGIITGASAGIGRAIAQEMAKHGCHLTITGRNLSRLEETNDLCAKTNEGKTLIIKADMRIEQEIADIVKCTIQEYGRLDFVINNAGILHTEVLDDSMEKYHEVLQVDQHSIVYLNKLALPYLEQSKGCIINVSSISGARPIPGSLAYGMAKAALDHYTRIMAIDLAPKGIRINNVSPGIIRTDVFANAGLPAVMVDAIWEKAKTWNDMNRHGSPAEVAGVVRFLLSQKSSQTTGAIVLIDGGFVNMCYNTGESFDIIAAMKN